MAYKYKVTEKWATGPEVTIEAEGESEAEALAKVAIQRPGEGFMRIQLKDRVAVHEERRR